MPNARKLQCPGCRLIFSAGQGETQFAKCKACGQAFETARFPAKICSVCGKDVSQQKRTKDTLGNYFCNPCWQSKAATSKPLVQAQKNPVGATIAPLKAEKADDDMTGLPDLSQFDEMDFNSEAAPEEELFSCPTCNGMFPLTGMDSSGICKSCAKSTPPTTVERRALKSGVITHVSASVFATLSVSHCIYVVHRECQSNKSLFMQGGINMNDSTVVTTGLFWLLFSTIVGIYSRRKGGSFIAGFLMSVILSPLIAGLITLVRKPLDDKLEKRQLSQGTMKKCPQCAELIKVEAVKCRFCGALLGGIRR